MILQRACAVRVLEPGAHDGLGGISRRVRDDVDRLLLALCITVRAQERVRRLGDELRLGGSVRVRSGALIRSAAGETAEEHDAGQSGR